VCVEQLHLAFTFNDLDLAGFNASAFAIAVAADMGVAASQISGLTVTAGSVVVTFQLLPAGDADRFEPETLETLVATVRLPNSRAGGEGSESTATRTLQLNPGVERPLGTSCRAGAEGASSLGVWKAPATSKADPRQQQGWILKCRMGEPILWRRYAAGRFDSAELHAPRVYAEALLWDITPSLSLLTLSPSSTAANRR
jgi:hypothetical protein